jgi:hypothetical protein
VCNLQAPLGYATVISKSYNTHTHTLTGLILGIQNNLGGGPVVRVWTKRFASSVISGSSPMVAHMMATGGLHGR